MQVQVHVETKGGALGTMVGICCWPKALSTDALGLVATTAAPHSSKLLLLPPHVHDHTPVLWPTAAIACIGR